MNGQAGKGRKRKKTGNPNLGKKKANPVDPSVKEYLDEISYVYKKINRASSLLWSHDNELVKPKRRSIKSHAKSEENEDDTMRSKRSSKGTSEAMKQEYDWQKDSTAQIGYGEITKGAMQKFLQILQNIDKYFKPEHEEVMAFPKEQYKLTSNDTFIDIGSGFGKPVFHAAMQVGCYSKGIEIVPARVTFCLDFIYEYEEERKKKINIALQKLQNEGNEEVSRWVMPSKSPRKKIAEFKNVCNPIANDYADINFKEVKPPQDIDDESEEEECLKKLSKEKAGGKSLTREELKEKIAQDSKEVSSSDLVLAPNYSVLWCTKCVFEQVDAGKVDKIVLNKLGRREDITHVYSYNKVMGKDCLAGIGRSLNNTNFKILSWYVNEKTTYRIVKNVKLLFKMPMRSTGQEQFSVYVYFKTKSPENKMKEEEDYKVPSEEDI
ncbi:unnamed protein product [Moneuplotes crassus]|uniref:DOT1 domain-containing protein n=1 Tax=Euplotes crassus TaxID=5936 RepID=A0AAD1UGF3_EUPCR|nr:unnamed protein product [Moneuplotes crassus]